MYNGKKDKCNCINNFSNNYITSTCLFSECKDMSKWWKVIIEFREKKKGAEIWREISNAEWMKHFKSLIGGKSNEEIETIEIGDDSYINNCRQARELKKIKNSKEYCISNDIKSNEASECEMIEIKLINNDFDMEELEKALKKVNKGKAAGTNKIQFEFIRVLKGIGRKEVSNSINYIGMVGIYQKME